VTNDMLSWAQESPGVGDASGDDLVKMAEVTPEVPKPYERKIRSRPNRGRVKRTNRTPPLEEPPWDMLRELKIPLPPYLRNLRTTPANWRRGPSYVTWKRRVLDRYGDMCHLCGHGQAFTADHLIPLSVWCNQPYEPMLARPAHGIEGCPTCHIPCNSSRGNKQLARQTGNYQPAIEL
jgi:hypothetical protein